MMHSIEAEMSVLGSMLLSDEASASVLGTLEAADFHRHAHQTIFAAMKRLRDRNMGMDVVLLVSELGGKLESIGGEDYLVQLAEYVPSPANADHYAARVKELSVRRSLEQAGKAIAHIATEPEDGESADDLVSKSVAKLMSVSGMRRSASSTAGELALTLQRSLDDSIDGVIPDRVEAPFAAMARIKPYLYPGELFVIGARPGMGKTAFGLSMALDAGRSRKVQFFSAEMTRSELGFRMVQMLTGYTRLQVERNPNDEVIYRACADAFERIARLNLEIDATPAMTTDYIRSRVLKAKATGGLDLAIIDYLGILKLPKAKSRYESMGEACWDIKNLAKEAQIPVVLMVQLNRQTEGRTEKRPNLGDIRDCGEIEQHADVVAFPFWEGYYDDPTKRADIEPAELIIAKHRNGETGKVPMFWQGSYACYRDGKL